MIMKANSLFLLDLASSTEEEHSRSAFRTNNFLFRLYFFSVGQFETLSYNHSISLKHNQPVSFENQDFDLKTR